jgi:polysaccharide biosynthesis protein PelF
LAKTSVLITTEGTYPCYPGGVSVWCDYLVRELPEVDFHILALNHAPEQPLRFSFPANVASCSLLPIWGTEMPGSPDDRVLGNSQKKERTGASEIRQGYLPHFGVLAQAFVNSQCNSERLGRAMYGIHQFCREHDYATAAASPQAWEVFLSAAERSDLDLNLEDARNCMRWTQRNLSLLAMEYPQVDLVHSSIAGLAGIPGVLGKVAHGSGYLLTEHGLHLRELNMSLARAPYSKACRLFLSRFHRAIALMNYHFADRISSLGEFSKRWQTRLGADPAKLIVVPNGTDPSRYFPGPSVHRPRPTILSMARISPIKGIETLIRASDLVRLEVPDVRVRIMGEIGDSGYHQHCLGLVESLNVHHTVEFGSTQDGGPVYREADVFCLPSLSEGMPFAVLEAMMSGCPVVASDVGSVGDMLQGFGVLVRPNCPEKLAAALVSLLSGPDVANRRAAMARKAREHALTNFTIASFAARHRAIYGELTRATARLSRRAS